MTQILLNGALSLNSINQSINQSINLMDWPMLSFFSVHLASDPDNCCHHPVVCTKRILDHSLLCKYYLHTRIHYMRTRTCIFRTK